jgi:hypothetical protein
MEAAFVPFLKSDIARPSGISCLVLHRGLNSRESSPRGFACGGQFLSASTFEPVFSSSGGIKKSLVSVLLFHPCFSFSRWR